MSSDQPGPPTDDKPRCRCGHDRDHYMVSPVPSYSFLGWFLVVVGISAPMQKMDFVCRTCGQTIETTTDEKLMESYRHRA
jgi:hypothetical protein